MKRTLCSCDRLTLVLWLLLNQQLSKKIICWLLDFCGGRRGRSSVNRDGFTRNASQVFNRYSFSVRWWFEIRFNFDRSFIFWCLGVISCCFINFTCCSLVFRFLVFWRALGAIHTSLFCWYTYTCVNIRPFILACILQARAWLRLSQLLSLLIAFDFTYWKRLLLFISAGGHNTHLRFFGFHGFCFGRRSVYT